MLCIINKQLNNNIKKHAIIIYIKCKQRTDLLLLVIAS